jgi:hypothetical protein
MDVLSCSAAIAMAAASPNSGEPQMRQGRWETTSGQRNTINRVGNTTSPGRDQPPVTTTSICSGGPLPGKSPPNQKGCEVRKYRRTSHSVHMTTICRRGDGSREEATVMTFSPSRYDWQTRVTVSQRGMTVSFEDYGTSRWVGPCKHPS